MATSGLTRRRGTSNLVLILSAIALCCLGYFLFRREVYRLESIGFVHFPYCDDWDTPLRFLALGLDGNPLSFLKQLFDQHNESRKVTLKLLTLLIDRFQVFHSDLSIDLSFLIRALTVLVVCVPLLASSISSLLWWFIRLGVIGYCMQIYAIGPANLFNGLWYVQISFFLGLMFSSASIALVALALHLRRVNPLPTLLDPTASAIFAGLTGFLAIFSFAGNFALLPVAAVMIFFFDSQGGFRSRLQRLFSLQESKIILISLGVSVAAFFYGYQTPPAHVKLHASFPNPFYILNFLTNAYRPEGLPVLAIAQIFTALLLILLLGWSLAMMFGLLPVRLSWPATPLLGQLLFLVALAVLSSLGRGADGPGVAFAERYNSVSLLLNCLFVVFFSLFAEDLFAGSSVSGVLPVVLASGRRQLYGSMVLAVLAGNLAIGLHANEAWRQPINQYFSQRRTAVACMKNYVSARMRGKYPSQLTEEGHCATLLYPPGAEWISERYVGSWCESGVTNKSRTIASLCRELRSAPASARSPLP